MRLRKLLEDGDITPAQVSKFYASARAFYTRAVEYALENLPLQDELLRNARLADFSRRETATFNEAEYFVQR